MIYLSIKRLGVIFLKYKYTNCMRSSIIMYEESHTMCFSFEFKYFFSQHYFVSCKTLNAVIYSNLSFEERPSHFGE